MINLVTVFSHDSIICTNTFSPDIDVTVGHFQRLNLLMCMHGWYLMRFHLFKYHVQYASHNLKYSRPLKSILRRVPSDDQFCRIRVAICTATSPIPVSLPKLHRPAPVLVCVSHSHRIRPPLSILLVCHFVTSLLLFLFFRCRSTISRSFSLL